MMKNIIVSATLLICTILPTQAQHKNELTFSLGAGSSTLRYPPNLPAPGQTESRPGGSLGVGYSNYFTQTIGVSLGLETEMFNSYYRYKSHNLNAVVLQIPVMLQFQFPLNKKNFIFLGTGVKTGYPVLADFYYYNPHNQNRSLSFLLALEGGLKFSIGTKNYLYTGVFLDYALNKVSNSSAPSDSGFGIKPFAVGIKFKLGIGMGGEKAPKAVRAKAAAPVKSEEAKAPTEPKKEKVKKPAEPKKEKPKAPAEVKSEEVKAPAEVKNKEENKPAESKSVKAEKPAKAPAPKKQKMY